MSPLFSLENKTCLVSAGCAGIGKVVAELLAQCGAKVVATTRSEERAGQASAEWRGQRRSITSAVCDFSEASVHKLVQEMVCSHGGIQVLVNAAGGRFAAQPPEKSSKSDFIDQFEANVLQAFRLSELVVAQREATQIGSIVNIGSIYGSLAVDHRIYDDPSRQTPISYAVAKAGLAQMTRYLAAYWGPLGVRVNCVSPGGVRRNQTESFAERYNSRIPLKRMAESQEVAGVVAFLAMPASAYLTGQELLVDGGLHIW